MLNDNADICSRSTIRHSKSKSIDVGSRLINKGKEYNNNISQKQWQNYVISVAKSSKASKYINTTHSKASPKVEDRLIESGKKSKLAIEHMQNLQKLMSKNATPVISDMAKQIERDKDIVTRLNEYKLMLDKKKDQMKAKRNEEEHCSFKPYTNQIQGMLFPKRNLNKSSECIAYNDPNCTFHPQISKKSHIISLKLGNPKERLLEPKQTSCAVTPQYSFNPTINSHSKAEINKSENKWEQLYNDGYKMKLKKEEKQKKREHDHTIEMLDNCTFHPILTRRDKQSFLDAPIEERAQEWYNQKEEKLKSMRQVMNLNGIEQCTFRPQVNTSNTHESFIVPKSLESINKYINKMASVRSKKFNDDRNKLGKENSNEIDRSICSLKMKEAMKELHNELFDIS